MGNKFNGFPGMGGNNFNNILKQAQKMQQEVMKSQEQISAKEFDASVGGGAVSVKITGDKVIKELLKVKPDMVVVMYAGKVIEKGTTEEIFHNPMHPYTIGLQKSKPTLNSDSDTLYNIPGNVPNPVNMPQHCYFKERCAKCTAKCSGAYPGMVQVSPTHFVACHLYNDMKEGK